MPPTRPPMRMKVQRRKLTKQLPDVGGSSACCGVGVGASSASGQGSLSMTCQGSSSVFVNPCGAGICRPPLPFPAAAGNRRIRHRHAGLLPARSKGRWRHQAPGRQEEKGGQLLRHWGTCGYPLRWAVLAIVACLSGYSPVSWQRTNKKQGGFNRPALLHSCRLFFSLKSPLQLPI